MFTSSKNKKIRIVRIGFLMIALALFGIFGGIGTTGVHIASAQANIDQNHICEEKDGKFIPQKEPCAAKEIIKCQSGQKNDPCTDPAVKADCQQVSCNVLIKDYVEPGIKVLTGLMGIVVATSIVVAGIQYGSAGSDPGKVGAAKKRLSAAIIALLAYLFMFGFLQWLLPGGIL